MRFAELQAKETNSSKHSTRRWLQCYYRYAILCDRQADAHLSAAYTRWRTSHDLRYVVVQKALALANQQLHLRTSSIYSVSSLFCKWRLVHNGLMGLCLKDAEHHEFATAFEQLVDGHKHIQICVIHPGSQAADCWMSGNMHVVLDKSYQGDPNELRVRYMNNNVH